MSHHVDHVKKPLLAEGANIIASYAALLVFVRSHFWPRAAQRQLSAAQLRCGIGNRMILATQVSHTANSEPICCCAADQIHLEAPEFRIQGGVRSALYLLF